MEEYGTNYPFIGAVLRTKISQYMELVSDLNLTTLEKVEILKKDLDIVTNDESISYDQIGDIVYDANIESLIPKAGIKEEYALNIQEICAVLRIKIAQYLELVNSEEKNADEITTMLEEDLTVMTSSENFDYDRIGDIAYDDGIKAYIPVSDEMAEYIKNIENKHTK